MKPLQDFRKEYTKGTLDTNVLTKNPMDLFNKWLQDAIAAELPDPNAMTVATVDASGQPSQRIVLLKDVSDEGFVFYTNLGSRKAKELKHNDKISLHFPWYFLERQVRVCGIAQPLPRSTVAKYFFSRPKSSQLGAWASQQSTPISTRQLLVTQFMQVKEKFAKGEIPLPDFWGGYLVKPSQIEFWQGGEHRLHDRFEYNKAENGEWDSTRLMP
ncbi:pyridoxamine 5'-phosphate oxidase [Glaciecola punicea ACAM 611]|jgi:pyridoxamine 5'-phosphate oxidase|uniref:Pyridoxine/pyridoxamine 5'-phosphate oxidase n=1 Tax=Glaciecola punicea ACAM 611 TaxID=1121923 RepID=H5T833_9ALTE|nr:pyridoxamine 5'-phosphate oxidase [Glaciecola punicea]OFA30660.1 pyridoxamine 5'-phosphate oxidase [Glaciecola punicea]GAB54460.1 pyridoxamine 5'-phosphate oxidase [Glaciecola punicea ACAM 611]